MPLQEHETLHQATIDALTRRLELFTTTAQRAVDAYRRGRRGELNQQHIKSLESEIHESLKLLGREFDPEVKGIAVLKEIAR